MSKSRSFTTLLCIFILGVSWINAQSINIPLDSIQAIWPEQKVVLKRSNVTYSIKTGRKDDPIKVTENSRDTYIALKDNTSAYDLRFYNNYSEILKHQVSGTGTFNKYTSQRCGSYEIDGIFYHDAKLCEFLLRFQEEGEHLTIDISKAYYDQRYFTKIALSNPYGVVNKKIRIECPENVELEILEMNFGGYDIKRSDSRDDKKKRNIITYELSMIPPYLMLDNLPNFQCTFPHLLLTFRSFEHKGERIPLMENTDDLYRWYRTFITPSNIPEDLKQECNELCSEAASDTACVASVFQYVQDNIRYLAFYEGYAAFMPELAETVYRNKFGDCKGMANLCKAMLLYLGYDARLCWVYSGRTCYPRDLPSIAADNHVICAVNLGGSFIYLDPTSKYVSLLEIPDAIEGKECIVEDGENYIIGKIPEGGCEKNLRVIENQISIDGDIVNISGNIEMHGIHKNMMQSFLGELPTPDKEEFIKYLVTTGSNNYSIKDFSSTELNSKVDTFRISYTLELKNAVISFGNEIMILPELYREYAQQIIDSNRQYPYTLEYTSSIRQKQKIIIPEGYMLSSMPASIHIIQPEIEINAGYEHLGDEIIYSKEIKVRDELILRDRFSSWNDAIEQLNMFYNEALIFKKQNQ